MMRRSVHSILLVALMALLTACPSSSTSPAPVIGSFKAEPASIASGGSSTLSWSVSGAERLVLDPGSLDVTGKTSHSVSPAGTTTYTLTASSKTGSSRRQVTVTVDVPPLEAVVDPEVKPGQASLPDDEGQPQPIAGSRDANGVQSDFLIGQVLIRPATDDALREFLERYDGTVIGNDEIPEPPASLGITLTPKERQATSYLVSLNLAKVNPDTFAADAARAGIGGLIEISTHDGLLTLAAATNALADGYAVSPNYVNYPSQAFPTTLLTTREGNGDDAFDLFGGKNFEDTGITAAWQFVAAHGINRRARVAIIDAGFWLNPDGTPRGSDHDFLSRPIQFDFQGSNMSRAKISTSADGPNPAKCGSGDDDFCYWHGTGAASSATGILNNGAGAAGSGGLAADPWLFKTNFSKAQNYWAIRTATAWGADVVSMSYSGDCDSVACRQFDRNYQPFSEMVAAGSRTVFIAAAGNGDDNGVGYQVGEPHFVHPCVMSHVICVGALAADGVSKIGYSNHGVGVDIFAPTSIPVMASPDPKNSDPDSPAARRSYGGTSAATPFVAGVVAMMKAIDPTLTGAEVRQILHDTARPGSGDVERRLDAHAAVARAAEGINGVSDRLEFNSLESPHHFTGSGPWVERDLNLHDPAGQDYYRFDSPGRGIMRIDLSYPEALGHIPMKLAGDAACPPRLDYENLSKDSLSQHYIVTAGSQILILGGGLVSAYNLEARLGAGSSGLRPDDYEDNDEPAEAVHLSRSASVTIGGVTYRIGIDSSALIEANLHDSLDEDWYVVKGVDVASVSGGGYADAYSTVRIYGNESPITFEVFAIDDVDGMPGKLLDRLSSESCNGSGMSVTLESGKSYFVRVSGAAGKYSLSNFFSFYFHLDRIPVLIPRLEDMIQEYFDPSGPRPNELTLRNPISFGFVADPAVTGVSIRGSVQLQLFDAGGTLLQGSRQGPGLLGGLDRAAQSVSDSTEQHVDLRALEPGGFHALLITPLDPGEEGRSVEFTWSEAEPRRTSGNLIRNPGADAGLEAMDDPEYWGVVSGDWSAVSRDRGPYFMHYHRIGEGLPGPDAAQRGRFLFAGGPGSGPATMIQEIGMPDEWRTAVDAGRVKFSLGAFLGGQRDFHGGAKVTLTFIDGALRELGRVTLGPVTSHERDGETGLWPVGTRDYIPGGTTHMEVMVEFSGDTDGYRYGLADALELVLMEYAP